MGEESGVWVTEEEAVGQEFVLRELTSFLDGRRSG